MTVAELAEYQSAHDLREIMSARLVAIDPGRVRQSISKRQCPVKDRASRLGRRNKPI